MLIQFKKGEKLGYDDDVYRLWSDIWMPELKKSTAGKIMEENDMFKYYSNDVKEALGLKK